MNVEESTNVKEVNNLKKVKMYKNICFIIFTIVLLWFGLTLFEYNRVNNDKKPIICFHEIKDIEDDDEYSKMCYGIFYKYKEYYYQENDALSAREFTLIFKEFTRKA